jgi:hypothetical protein
MTGMMDAAYFTGRKELLEFFNDLLDLNLKKIEETAPGAIDFQLTEAIFPGTIPMTRVSWEARTDYEFCSKLQALVGRLYQAPCAAIYLCRQADLAQVSGQFRILSVAQGLLRSVGNLSRSRRLRSLRSSCQRQGW